MIAAVVATAAAALAVAAPAHAATRVIAVDGVSKRNANQRVEILVQVKAGQNARVVADRELAAQGAKRTPAPDSQAFTTTGLFWASRSVTQYYNGAGAPANVAGSAFGELQNTQRTWTAAPPNFTMVNGGANSTRCPSLVKGCPGGQRTDGFNDVGWSRLSGSTLGVTWYVTSGAPEADMSINTRYRWSTGACNQVTGSYDLETVYLHENGHVAGLGHSSVGSAVMYPSYHGALCSLQPDDLAGLDKLY